MNEEKIRRINELAKKHKTEGLTEAELQERQALHAEYIADYRRNLKNILDNTRVLHPDGSKTPLKPMEQQNGQKKAEGGEH